MKNLKSNKGITLAALIITVIVLVIIAGTATYTAIDVYQDAKQEALVQELQIIQNAVNNEVSKIEAEQKNYGDYIVNGEDIDNQGYVRYESQEFEEKFGVTAINQTVKVNLVTAEVKVEKDGTEYLLSDLAQTNQVSKNYSDNELLGRYIKDGLLLHLDGVNNTNEGHSNTATTWTDLVTKKTVNINGNTSGQSIWEEKAFVGHGTEYMHTLLPELYREGKGTVETFVTRNNNYGESTSNYTAIGKFAGGVPGAGLIIGFTDSFTGVFMRFSNDGSNSNYSSYYEDGGKFAKEDVCGVSAIVDYNENNTTAKYIVNGNKTEYFYSDKKIIYDDNIYFYIGIQNGYLIEDNIHEVRVYGRALTEPEALNNYYIDLYRFEVQ